MKHKYPFLYLIKARVYLQKAKDLICLGVAEGKCSQCVCSDTDECFINSLEAVKNEIELRRREERQGEP